MTNNTTPATVYYTTPTDNGSTGSLRRTYHTALLTELPEEITRVPHTTHVFTFSPAPELGSIQAVRKTVRTPEDLDSKLLSTGQIPRSFKNLEQASMYAGNALVRDHPEENVVVIIPDGLRPDGFSSFDLRLTDYLKKMTTTSKKTKHHMRTRKKK